MQIMMGIVSTPNTQSSALLFSGNNTQLKPQAVRLRRTIIPTANADANQVYIELTHVLEVIRRNGASAETAGRHLSVVHKAAVITGVMQIGPDR